MKKLMIALFALISISAQASELGKEVARADDDLNAAYSQLRDFYKSTPGTQDEDSLRDAQRAWIAFRDANCKHYVAIDFQENGEKYNSMNCLIEQSDARTSELMNIAKYTLGEGDENDI